MGISTSHLREEAHSIPLRIAKGHFATNHCHVNYYLDMTYTKHRLAEAREAARELVAKLDKSSPIDTILCLDGTEVIGTCLAEELQNAGISITNEHGTIYVVTPEISSGNQTIFRSNTAHLIRNRHVLILAATIATGDLVYDAVHSVKYYGGIPEGICAVFSAGQRIAGIPITSIFTKDILNGFLVAAPADCPLCKAGVKLDALVNSYGISSL
ncbi:MAG: orotate phosphoribosyltransferase [Oscillospiraceae bacterium]|nr:orotate phosphoribosyltransferase [Oscillospiraceae bacterium]